MTEATSGRGTTPSQTIGPFFRDALAWCAVQTVPAADGWIVRGSVLDGRGQPVDDALVEVWQPRGGDGPAAGVAPGFQRVATDAAGRFAFTIRKPERQHAVGHVTVFARGLLRALRTRVYIDVSVADLRATDGFGDLPDVVLGTLIARAEGEEYGWDVRLQGEDETLFLELT